MKSTGLFLSFLVLLSLIGIFASHAVANPAPASHLRVALIHFNVSYKKPDQNFAELVTLHRKAAQQGAKVILNTELALSGYSFTSREDVAPFTLTPGDTAVKAMAELAKELDVFIGMTFPERDPGTGIFYNSAFVFSPEGRTVLRYRKIYGEKRWARPGNPLQKATFDTQWGRVGVAICADTYFGLIPRTLALKGADLLWVPANWPTIGRLTPLDIWKTRARENGIFLAACNRTGKDRLMDCSEAVSAVIDPEGIVLKQVVSETSALLMADIPLTEKGRLSRNKRLQRMADRQIDLYRPIYLDPWTKNLTQYLKLPDPGKLRICALVPDEKKPLGMEEIKDLVKHRHKALPTLYVLPRTRPGAIDPAGLADLAKKHNLGFALSFSGDQTRHPPLLVTTNGAQAFVTPPGKNNSFPFQLLHFGPAVLALVPMETFRHPELGVVLAKQGCDLVLLSEEKLSESDIRTCTVRPIDNLAVAATSFSSALIGHMKGIHGDLQISRLQKPGICTIELDTAETREKKFYGRVDFDALLITDTGEMR